jgi:hypothetical protein
MSNDNITEWLLSLSMDDLLDLEFKLKAEIKAMAKEKAAEEERLEQARLEQLRLDQERQQKAAQERAAAASRPRPLPTNLYASVDQLAASQGLDISGLMNEIARKAAQKPKPKPKTGSGSGSGSNRR